MKKFDTPIKAKLIDGIEHQGIGGKVIILERELTLNEILSIDTIAMYNFVNRRHDLINAGILTKEDIEMIRKGETTVKEFDDKQYDFQDSFKIYYGHVGNLGYFVAEDEIDGELEEVDWNEASKYLNS